MATTFQLNEAQLAELKAFILKRGMREPDVVNEILDHFACKIEELMSQEPNLHFEDAIKLAHKSFGSTGFRPITKAYEEGLDKIIWAAYKRSVKSVLLSPSVLFFISASILTFYFLQILPDNFQKQWMFGMHFWVSMIPVLGFMSANILYSYKTKRKLFSNWKKKDNLNLWEMKSMGIHSHSFIILVSLIFPHDYSGKPIPSAFYIIAASICFLSFINAFAQYKTMLKMQEQFGTKKQLI